MTVKNNTSEIELFVISSIKKMREEKGLTQAQFALEMNVTYGFIGQVESPNFRAKYNLNHINQAAKIFKCSIKDFFPVDPF